jgi:hypothetical protein
MRAGFKYSRRAALVKLCSVRISFVAEIVNRQPTRENAKKKHSSLLKKGTVPFFNGLLGLSLKHQNPENSDAAS